MRNNKQAKSYYIITGKLKYEQARLSYYDCEIKLYEYSMIVQYNFARKIFS